MFTYRTTFDCPNGVKGLALWVKTFDQVVVVLLNGASVGTIWCAPWELELPAEALKASGNVLELNVTNAWRNRLVDDEQEPADCAFEPAPIVGGAFSRVLSAVVQGRPGGASVEGSPMLYDLELLHEGFSFDSVRTHRTARSSGVMRGRADIAERDAPKAISLATSRR